LFFCRALCERAEETPEHTLANKQGTKPSQNTEPKPASLGSSEAFLLFVLLDTRMPVAAEIALVFEDADSNWHTWIKQHESLVGYFTCHQHYETSTLHH
jgi:hypothetical protein